MDCGTPGLPVHHQLPELAQTHVHPVDDTIQPCHPLSSPSPPAFNLSQHRGLFHWVSSLHQVVKVLELQLQHYVPSNEYPGLISFRIDWFVSLWCKGYSRIFSGKIIKLMKLLYIFLRRHRNFLLCSSIKSHFNALRAPSLWSEVWSHSGATVGIQNQVNTFVCFNVFS